jgi:rifampicin phosphotransferase
MSALIPESSSLVIPVSSELANLDLAGGKGANLAVLARAGFPVPGGYILTTHAYRCFVSAHQLDDQINTLLAQTNLRNPLELEQVSQQIRGMFRTRPVPPAVLVELDCVSSAMAGKALAVRSSATAEDLPEVSFAGQQDTFLNIAGRESLVQAAVECWSSLWTARAIGYRSRNRVPHQGAALAVVIQEMVPSAASGVLFTANPLTGLRLETVIDAACGLGEALVSGQTEPDHYVVDPARQQVTHKTLGSKAVSIHSLEGGGTHTLLEDRSLQQALPDEEILRLAELGRQVEQVYQFPQDIEWAWDGQRLYLLQSRPITSLFPLPDGLPPGRLLALMSLAAVQGMLDPLTPLGVDFFRQMVVTISHMFGMPTNLQRQTALYLAGERIWINLTPLLTNSVGRKVLPNIFRLVEPALGMAVEQVLADPGFQPARPGVRLRTILRLGRFFFPVAANAFLNLLSPDRRREYIVRQGERILERLEQQIQLAQGDSREKLSHQISLLPGVIQGPMPRQLILLVSGVASGMASWNLARMLALTSVKSQAAVQTARAEELALQLTRGMPHNPTTQMDLALWHLSQLIREDPETAAIFSQESAAELWARCQGRDLPEPVLNALEYFLQTYGGRGLAEIDLGRPRWAEDPTPILETLKSYLLMEEPGMAPSAVFQRGAEAAQAAAQELESLVRHTRAGALKARAVRFLARRTRRLMGMREYPKFFMVRLLWVIRRALLETGRELVESGDLEKADDLFFLGCEELAAFARRENRDWAGIITSRRLAYERELRRRQIPRLLLSDGRAFYEGLGAQAATNGAVVGSPVSPGLAQGRVRVVLDPRQSGLLPGEILVCPGTDPSWTPLFLAAAGLVMEVGGMMTHGAVVAREYGIPAVVGVDQATGRFQTGQLIQVNGTSGQVTLLEDPR